MTSRLREIRKARGLTLADVAARCEPPTTAVTIGRLETGTRQLTVPWIERLSRALDVEPRELIAQEGDSRVPVAAQLTAEGAQSLSTPLALHPPAPAPGAIGLVIRDSQGDYRAGDQLWLEQLPPPRFAEAVNTDILVPRSVGRFTFGRLVASEGSKLHILPSRPGSRQTVVADAPWIARLSQLIRNF
ncbi:helix-turn-helix transcriptional regulator [Sandaracinobacter sp. RS1-74]|uniref:helix-turn-helix domain-containing protein n=1 Tax=Sandaracinobacteroides sayramensis TaxID=2913411 RepID=UPI001EDB39C7|nr:helix-turn-helix transcriptional regulator [Sandaracinobacteroides sayramensis]MCG2839772.1 helix-turn-helix transcriptional regulator [Sandaracinobacteroides sayramensis]